MSGPTLSAGDPHRGVPQQDRPDPADPPADVDPDAIAPEELTEEDRREAEPAPVRDLGDPAEAQGLAIDLARLLADDKCEDVAVFDVRGLSPLTSYLVLGTGTSDRQVKATADHVEQEAKRRGAERFGTDADGDRRWVVLDFVDVMVHLFEPATRGHYDLEMLWGDAPRVSWRRG